MGDKRRNLEFAKFIAKQWDNVNTILVVADGKGELSKCLSKLGYTPVVIEKKPRFKGNVKHHKVEYKKGVFTENTKINAELIVGMHPDEATAPIVIAAIKQNKPFAIVPCCFCGKEAEGINDEKSWINKLKKLSNYSCQEYVLPISGKNIVLFKK